MEHLDKHVEIIKSLSKADVPKLWSIRYFLWTNNDKPDIYGYSIDLGTYDTKTEAVQKIKSLTVATGHNKFYLIESGSWSIISNNDTHTFLNMGKLDEAGATLFKRDYTAKAEKVEKSDNITNLIEAKDPETLHFSELTKLLEMKQLHKITTDNLKILEKQISNNEKNIDTINVNTDNLKKFLMDSGKNPELIQNLHVYKDFHIKK
jgi:hypothetical protein